jgi:hypothetical protein
MRSLFQIGNVRRALTVALFCVATASWAAHELPPLPRGVTELRFSEFFVSPVGERGLELTEKLKALDGKRVRILGYMVREEHAQQGSFLLTPVPVQLHDHDSALADDLPCATARVMVPGHRPVLYTPQFLLLTGTLSLGNREEPDGRISLVRLTLDISAIRKPTRLRAEASSSRGGARHLMNERNFNN